MWSRFVSNIIRKKYTLISIICGLTIFMIYLSTRIELSYEFARILPKDDPTYNDYEKFRQLFGEDGSIMFIGVQDEDLFTKDVFNDWADLSGDIRKINGIQEVISVADIFTIERNDSLQALQFRRIRQGDITTDAEMDSLRDVIRSLPFYDKLVLNKETGASIMAITFKKKDLNSSHRIRMVADIHQLADAFSAKHDMRLHYSGMPYIRTVLMQKVAGEMKLFMILAVLIMSLLLWLFFRNFKIVLYSIFICTIGVIWSMGLLVLFNYKITLLTGLVPPLIMVIGIPNCVFLINKFHHEVKKHGNRIKAISRMLNTIGISLLLANVTTAIGFAVLYFTDSSLLQEFGILASVNVMITFFITLVFIPFILSLLPLPTEKETGHLENRYVARALKLIDHLVHNHRRKIYLYIGILTVIALFGITKVDLTGYIVDDLPKKDPVYEDLKFFESNFNGVLPFEIFVDTKKPGGVFGDNAKALYRINAFQKSIRDIPELSRPVSVAEAIKFAYQGYRGGEPKYYIIPGATELKNLSNYIRDDGNRNRLFSFLDSTGQYTRISIQMADIGSTRVKALLNEVNDKIDSVFRDTGYDVKISGHGPVYLKGNDYLLMNLIESLIIEIILITIVGFILFRSLRIILLSKLPCLIPLVITAGIMGFLGIRFKPSTILIFSIAFGIASDGTIYFLTKYRQELKHRGKSIAQTISLTIADTGMSMIYTAVILFFGFAIFAASEFGGTSALGILLSITLLVSMITNLVLLPAILVSINQWVSRKEILQTPLIELDDEEVEEPVKR